MTRKIRIGVAFIVIVSVLPVQAEVYKWVDENGRTHYGEKPPSDNASKIEIRESPTSDELIEKRNVERDKLLEVYEEERRQKKEEKLKAEAERKQKEKYCLKLENDLKEMQRINIFYELDENGERKYLSEEVVAGRKKEMEDNYKKFCK